MGVYFSSYGWDPDPEALSKAPHPPPIWKGEKQNSREDKTRFNAEAVVRRLVAMRHQHGWPPLDLYVNVEGLLGLLGKKSGFRSDDLRHALAHVPGDSTTPLEDLERLLVLRVADRQRDEAPRRMFRIEVPIENVLYGDFVRRVRLLGRDFYFVSLQPFPAVPMLAELPAHWNREFTRGGKARLLFEAGGPAEDVAWKTSVETVEALLGLLDYCMNQTHMNWGLGGPVRRCSLSPPSVVHAWEGEHLFPPIGTQSRAADARGSVPPVEASHWEAFAELVRELETEPSDSDVRSLLRNAARLYWQSMIVDENDRAFLHLWQLLEALTCPGDHRGGTDEIRRRVLSIIVDFTGNNGMLESCLRRLAEKRNEIAHSGLHRHISDDDINLLKLVCVNVMRWLFQRAARLKTVERLSLFFRLACQTDGAVAAHIETCEFIQEFRGLRHSVPPTST